MTAGWHTFSHRLRWAIDQQPSQGRRRGLRLFQYRMVQAAPDVAGTSLTAIQGYLRGDAEPSLAFVESASRLLGVRAAWLAWQDGAPTEADEAARREAPEEQLAGISHAVRVSLGVPAFSPPASWAPTVRQLLFAQQGDRRVKNFLAGRSETYTDEEALADVAEAISAPLRVLGIDAVGLRPVEQEHYVQAVALALQRTIQSDRDFAMHEEEEPDA